MADELTATIPDPELAKLEAMAVEHDTQAAEETSATEPEPAQPAAEETTPESEINPDSSETDPEKAKERPRDALGRFTKTETGEDIPEDKRQPAEQEKSAQTVSEYEQKKADRKQKEQDRLDKTWENVNRQKEELERRRQELDQERQRIAQQQQTKARPAQVRDITSRQLFQAHQDFKARAREALKDGDYDAYNQNDALAEQSLQHAQQFYQVEQQEAQQEQQQQYQALWVSKMTEAAKDEPDLMNPQSPLCQAMQKLLQEHGTFLYGNPDGFKYGLEFVKKQMAAESVSELRDKLTKAEAEVQRLTKATTPLGAGPTTPIQPRKLDDMSTDEQIKELERMAARADAEAAAA
jgi:hypothetical protein